MVVQLTLDNLDCVHLIFTNQVTGVFLKLYLGYRVRETWFLLENSDFSDNNKVTCAGEKSADF